VTILNKNDSNTLKNATPRRKQRGMIKFTDLNGIRLLGGTKFPNFGEIPEFTGKSNRENKRFPFEKKNTMQCRPLF